MSYVFLSRGRGSNVMLTTNRFVLVSARCKGVGLRQHACWHFGLDLARGVGVSLLWMLCVVSYAFLRRADHSSRGVLSSVMCLSVISKPQQWGSLGPLGGYGATKKILFYLTYIRRCRLKSAPARGNSCTSDHESGQYFSYLETVTGVHSP